MNNIIGKKSGLAQSKNISKNEQDLNLTLLELVYWEG